MKRPVSSGKSYPMLMQLPDLDYLISNASAAALVIIRGDAVIHRSGDLSEDGFRTLINAFRRYWLAGAHQEFNRYVGLRLDNQFHMLFAKFLPQGEDLLGLAFPRQKPLVRVRQDMTDILRSIIGFRRKISTDVQPMERSLQFGYQPSLQPDQQTVPHRGTGWHPESDQNSHQEKKMPQPADTSHNPTQSVFTDSGSRQRYLTFGAPMGRQEDSPRLEDHSKAPGGLMEDLPWQALDEDGLTLTDTDEFPEEKHYDDFSTQEDRSDLVEMLHEDILIEEQAAPAAGWQRDERFLGDEGSDMDKAEPVALPMFAADRKEDREEEIADVTGYLFPRCGGHYLVGALLQRLRTLLPEICDRYGWELSHLSVRPATLKWTLHDFPESLIKEMLHILRKETSRRILSLFPEIQAGEQSGDIWEPGYLVELAQHDFRSQALMVQKRKIDHLKINE